MKKYVCDACGREIDDPYKVMMKEFYVGCCFETFGIVPSDNKVFKKIHLCDKCFKGLRKIANK